MHEDVKWLLKTFPWEGCGLTVLFIYLIARSYLTEQIVFIQYRYGYTPAYVTLAEKPLDYYLLIAMLTVFLAAAFGYTIYRLAMRHTLLREETGRQRSDL